MAEFATAERLSEPFDSPGHESVLFMGRREAGISTYVALCGHDPASARIDHDRAFDRHVFASLLAVGAAEQGAVTARVGLEPDELARLMERWFPHAGDLFGDSEPQADEADDEVAMVRDLLRGHRSTPGDESLWLASMVARRAVEPNHLWEDLGLRERGELSRLLSRHFAPLAARNTRNMRWKRFFYRTLCETDGLVMCTAPMCSACRDFELCFGSEDGESRLAQRRRERETGTVLSSQAWRRSPRPPHSKINSSARPRASGDPEILKELDSRLRGNERSLPIG